MVVLNEGLADAMLRKFALMVALEKEPARILVHFRLNEKYPRNFGFDYLQVAPDGPSGSNRFHGFIAVSVVLVVILAIVAFTHVLQPGAIRTVPVDGLPHSLLQVHAGRPAQFSGDFGTFERVPAVVPGAVRHPGHQAFRLSQDAENAPHHG